MLMARTTRDKDIFTRSRNSWEKGSKKEGVPECHIDLQDSIINIGNITIYGIYYEVYAYTV